MVTTRDIKSKSLKVPGPFRVYCRSRFTFSFWDSAGIRLPKVSSLFRLEARKYINDLCLGRYRFRTGGEIPHPRLKIVLGEILTRRISYVVKSPVVSFVPYVQRN
jgi:hypothetical protein